MQVEVKGRGKNIPLWLKFSEFVDSQKGGRIIFVLSIDAGGSNQTTNITMRTQDG